MTRRIAMILTVVLFVLAMSLMLFEMAAAPALFMD